MKEMKFTTEIKASRDKVWDVLWRDETFRQWAGLIDPGTYMVGELKEGSEVQFISAENGYGVTSLVERLVAGELLLLRHQADTQGHGAQERDKEWTGGTESYSLEEKDGVTTLTVSFSVPPEQEEYFQNTYPKVMDKIKTLSENKAYN